jgi:prepilin-type N-terminal cleavage/methylation domain-containing protein
MRRGFTLIELLIVLIVIAALCAMMYGALAAIRGRADASVTQQVVTEVASAIATYNLTSISARMPDGRMYSAWAVGQDTTRPYPADPRWMDGDPRLYRAADPGSVLIIARAPSWYTGFIAMTGFTGATKTGVDNRGRIRDRWGQPLHIDWTGKTYGNAGFGVWSTGRDGRASTETTIQGGTADDINSWTRLSE